MGRLLAKDPDERPATAAETAEELARALAAPHEATAATDTTRRAAWVVGSVLLLALLLSRACIPGTHPTGPDSEPMDAAQPDSTTRENPPRPPEDAAPPAKDAAPPTKDAAPPTKEAASRGPKPCGVKKVTLEAKGVRNICSAGDQIPLVVRALDCKNQVVNKRVKIRVRPSNAAGVTGRSVKCLKQGTRFTVDACVGGRCSKPIRFRILAEL